MRCHIQGFNIHQHWKYGHQFDSTECRTDLKASTIFNSCKNRIWYDTESGLSHHTKTVHRNNFKEKQCFFIPNNKRKEECLHQLQLKYQ